MYRKWLIVALLLVLLLPVLFLGCPADCGPFSSEVRPSSPSASPKKGFEYFDDAKSHFALPIHMTLAKAQTLINMKAPKTFKTSKANFHVGPVFIEKVDVDVNRDDVVLAQAANNAISLKVNFNGRAIVHPQIGFLHPVIGVYISGHLTGSVAAELHNDWNVTLSVKSAFSLEKAEVRNVPVFGHVDITDQLRGPITTEVVKEIDKEIRIFAPAASQQAKALSSDAWTKMHSSLKLSDAPPAWLNVEPLEVRWKPIIVADNEIRLGAGIGAKTRVYVEETAPAIAPKPLPGLIIDPNLSNRSSLVVPVQASVNQLLPAIKNILEGKAFQEEGVTVRVANVTVNAPTDTIVVGFDFCATNGWFARGAKGRIYATGRVRFDEQLEVVSVADFGYTLETKSALLNVADWVFKPKIMDKVSTDAKADLKPILDDARKEAAKRVANLKPPSGIHKLTINIDKPIKLLNVRLSDGQLFFLFRIEGTSNIEL